MDIAFVSSQVYPFRKGGTEKRIHEIGRRLSDYGHEVTVYGCHWWDGPSTMEYEGMTLRGVTPGREQFSGDHRSITEALQFSAELAKPLSKNVDEHDLIVACVSEHFPVWVVRLVALRGTPVVTTWHEVWSHAYWREYLGPLGTVGWTVQAVTANVPQRPIAVSRMTAEKLSRIGFARDDIEVVPNGVDTEKITSAPPASDGFDVLFVGRLISEKNVDLLLSAFDTVADGRDVSLGVIGDGPQFDSLRERANGLRHSEDVTLLGFLEDEADVYGHMRAADVFVLPSTREGFGITTLEAMTAGCTPITVSHPDSAASEVVGDCGFVTDVSESGLADAITRAVDGETPDRDPVERARTFDWDRIARRAERVYAEAAGEEVRRRPSPESHGR